MKSNKAAASLMFMQYLESVRTFYYTAFSPKIKFKIRIRIKIEIKRLKLRLGLGLKLRLKFLLYRVQETKKPYAVIAGL
jgi:hypothetical protein